ncbi:MAG: peptidase M23 [Chitinophagaceae bacterium]|nr:MAG: peptidase M23 [Chitinophagaceae bacterium]
MKELNKISAIILLLGGLLFLASFESNAQSRSELEKQRGKLMEEIKLTQQMLEQTRQTRTESLQELETLNRQIQIREELMQNISRDLNLLDDKSEEINKVISSLERDLESIREEYAQLIVFAYRNRSSLNQIMYIFAAEDFNKSISRARYIREITDFRKKQAGLIEDTRLSLNKRVEEISEVRAEKSDLLQQENQQKQQLSNERNQHDRLVNQLRTQERELQREINQKQQTAERLNKAIEDIIKREIEEARRRAAEAQQRQDGNVLSLTPEAARLSADFASNMGKLPWPVQRGVVTSSFGTHPHPVLRGVQITNNGINIRTEENAEVRALFNGRISSVIYNPSFQNAIIVRHGEYFTVYSNLREVFVKSGQEIRTGERLGIVYTDSSEDKTEIHLEIWQGTKKLNPALWLLSQ